MNILLIHQNMPGQYKHFLIWLMAQNADGAGEARHRIVFITQRDPAPSVEGVEVIQYKPDHKPAKDAYGLSSYYEECTSAGIKVAHVCQALEADGFKPHVVIGHCGWGEMLFIKDVWPDVPVMTLFEYFFISKGGLAGFDPEFPASPNMPFFTRARNAVNYISWAQCDAGHVGTEWQRQTFPAEFHDKLKAAHEGIETDKLVPDPNASLALERLGRDLNRNDEIMTYVARNMEPTRGFHSFMRALPHLQEKRPHLRVIAIGGNEVSYGREAEAQGGWRAVMEKEVGDKVDWDRVHFVGRVPYRDFINILQIGRCHLYLTAPFVLSWSLLEAMSVEATVVAADVGPVHDVIEHGKNGFLVDFFDPEAIAEQVAQVLAHPDNFAAMGKAARRHVVENYDLRTVCLPEFVRQVNAILPADKQLGG